MLNVIAVKYKQVQLYKHCQP